MTTASQISALIKALIEESLDEDRSRNENTIEVDGVVHLGIDRESQSDRAFFESSIQPRQIPNVVEQLKKKGKDSDWVVFMFNTPNISTETDDRCLNLQYSIQNNMIGLDWVLLGQRNIADKVRIIEFIKSHGHTVTEQEINDIPYLRVENGDIYRLGLSVVEEFYRMTHDADIGVLVSGFSLLFGGQTLH